MRTMPSRSSTSRSLPLAWFLLAALFCSAAPTLAETLIGNDIRLGQGELRPATDPVLSNASGMLHIEHPVLGQIAAGRSTGPSGISLQGGLRPVPVPEPGTGLLLIAGASALIAVGRRRALRCLETRAVSIHEPIDRRTLIMRVPRRSFFASLSIAALVLGLLPFSASAQVPHDMAYQGVLTDAVGDPLSGPVDLVFRIYELPSGGSALYTETHTGVAIDPIDGAFLVQIGFGTTGLDTDGDGAPEANAFSFDSSLFVNGPNRYLEVQVGFGVIGEILAPRQMIGSVPYALVAEDVVTDPATSSVGVLIAAAQSAADTAQAAADTADSNHTTDTQLTPPEVFTTVSDLGFVPGAHTIDTQLTPPEVAAAATAQGFVTGAHTVNTNTQLSEAQVDGFVANNGFSTGTHTVDTNTQLSEAEVDGFVANNGFAAESPQGPHDRLGNNNTALGVNTLSFNTSTGNFNTAVGERALQNNATGDNNTASGSQALSDNITGTNNAAHGFRALFRNTAGNNTAIGSQALINNVTGSRNIALGKDAGINITTGSDNIAIGSTGAAGESATIRIGTAGTHTTTHLTGDVQIDGASISNVATVVVTAQSTANAAQATATANQTRIATEGPHDRPGAFNAALGPNALLNNTSMGIRNTAMGQSALQSNLTGDNNTASGFDALFANTSGSRNTASGRSALQNNNGSDNTASGYRALSSNTSGGANTASGSSALRYNTTGSSNTAIGTSALLQNIDGGGNTASGRSALRFNTSGSNNTGSGHSTLYRNTIGSNNTASGRNALFNNLEGFNNTAIGIESLLGNTTGGSNTVVGAFALGNNTTGNSNIAIGNSAGGFLTTGDNNIMIGNAGVAGESATIRIGTAGTHTTTHLTGDVQIDGASISNVATGVQAAQSTADAAQISANDILLGLFIRGTVGVGPHDRPGTDNTSVGVNALLNNTTGVSNTAVGVAALSDNNTGDFNGRPLHTGTSL